MHPIDFFWRAALRWPNRLAIDAPSVQLTYQQLSIQVCALAKALQTIDPSLQSRVGICASNSASHVVALLATLACGKIWVPLNPKSTAPEIKRITDVTEPSIVFADRESKHLVEHLLESRNTELIFIGSEPHSEGIDGLIALNTPASQPEFDLPSSATQAIKFTGGTTGLPKGVQQPYRAWLANITNQIHAWSFDENDRYVMAAPITHGTSTYLLPILAQGGCHVLMDGAGADAVRSTFRDRAGTVCFMPPTLVYMLMALPDSGRQDYPKLRRLIYGGAPMPADKIKEVRSFFGPVLGTTYGQTEAPQILTVLQPEDFEEERNLASVGRVTWFNDVAIMNPQGKILPPGEVGEVVAKGDLLMSGYWRLPEKTAETLVDGWLHTGDRGTFDDRGYLYLKDRLKDMVITGGFNVYPVDVENILGQHPAVHECAVFGVPDEKWGETVQAAVQLRAEQQASEADLIAFVRERLGPVQTPKRIFFHTALPRSTVGKVLKSTVREMAISGLK